MSEWELRSEVINHRPLFKKRTNFHEKRWRKKFSAIHREAVESREQFFCFVRRES